MTAKTFIRGHEMPVEAYVGQELACSHCGRWPVPVLVPAEFKDGKPTRWEVCPIDACLASIIEQLNRAGIYTAGCCCRHGRGPPFIGLGDGRELGLAQARRLNRNGRHHGNA